MASYTRLDPGFCVSLDRWLTAYSDSSAKLFKQIYKSMCCTRLFFFFQTMKSTYTCWYHRRSTCYILSRGWVLGVVECVMLVFTVHVQFKMCRCSHPGRSHLEALQSTAWYWRTTWRISCQTLWPCVAELSQHQAALWELALPLCNLHV